MSTHRVLTRIPLNSKNIPVHSWNSQNNFTANLPFTDSSNSSVILLNLSSSGDLYSCKCMYNVDNEFESSSPKLKTNNSQMVFMGVASMVVG